MKLKFKHQAYQADAVRAVVDCFQGQPETSGLKYVIDEGAASPAGFVPLPGTEQEGFANAALAESFVVRETATEKLAASAHSVVKYDLIGKIAAATVLTRRTVSRILTGINVADSRQYKRNPEDFILNAPAPPRPADASAKLRRFPGGLCM